MSSSPGSIDRPTPEIVRADAHQIRRAAALVLEGYVVAFPTETRYGLAADALSEAAVANLIAIKGRGAGHPIPLIVAHAKMLLRVVSSVPPRAQSLMKAHWPGPLTLILPGVEGLPQGVANEDGEVGVRISADPVTQQLVEAVARPITATSANLTGQLPATDAAAAACAGVVLVLDDGPRTAPPSTVARVVDGELVVIRQGAVRFEDGHDR